MLYPFYTTTRVLTRVTNPVTIHPQLPHQGTTLTHATKLTKSSEGLLISCQQIYLLFSLYHSPKPCQLIVTKNYK
jgi:hypothetical protein